MAGGGDNAGNMTAHPFIAPSGSIRFGNPITGVAKPGDTEAAHIPLYIWEQWGAWYSR